MTRECPQRFALVRLLAGELPAPQSAELASHLEECPDCRHTVDELQKNSEAYEDNLELHRTRLLARLDAENVPKRQRAARPRTLWFGALGLAGAFAGLLLFFVPEGATPPSAYQGYKGAFSVDVAARRGSRVFWLRDGARMCENDALRFVITTATTGFISVFSIDGRGRLSPFYPDTESTSDPTPLFIPEAGRHELPGSISLDDWLGDEHILVLFSPWIFTRFNAQEEIREQLMRQEYHDDAIYMLNDEVAVWRVSFVKAPCAMP